MLNAKIVRAGAIAILAITLTNLLSGCSSKAPEPAAAASILLGAHANSPDLNLNSPIIRDTVSKTIESCGFVSVVSVDGRPGLTMADSYELPDQYKGNPQLLKEMARKKAADLLSGLAGVRADDPEVDVLESLRLATRSFASAPENSEKIIIVVDSGLSTIGFLDFQNNLITSDSEAIAAALEQQSAIPDFTGITVAWQQMGDVAPPQGKLSPAQIAKLEAIWGAVIEKTGGTLILDKTVAGPEKVSGELPAVSTVSLLPEEPVRFDPVAAVCANDFKKPVCISEDQVRFIADSDKYSDPDAAKAVIGPVADAMKTDTGFTMLLIGTAAGDDNTPFSQTLSAGRAETVKKTLVSLGVPKKRIKTLGMGSSNPWHIHGAGTSGKLAAQNRKVVMLSADSPEAIEILKQ